MSNRLCRPLQGSWLTGRRGRLRRVAALLTLSIGLAAWITVATPAVGATATSQYVGAGSARCLDVPGSKTGDGTAIQIWDCNNGANQQFTYRGGTLQVLGKCLDVAGGATAAGTKVEIWTCNGGQNQQWRVNANGTITGVQSGLCLDVISAGTANSTGLQIWNCNGGSNQFWSRASSARRYVFTAFTNNSQTTMHVYASQDAVNFSPLKGAAYTAPSGLVRDPSVMLSGGMYYIVYTTNASGSTFGVAKSTDLMNWTFIASVGVGVSGTQETWAPEWFKDTDGSINVIVSLSSSSLSSANNFTAYKMTALNNSFTSWGPATPLTGVGPNYIDDFIVKSGGTYYDFTKNETTKYIELATANSLTGPYTFVGTSDWAGWGNNLEGPSVLQIDSSHWRIYMDGYASGQYFYSDSSDLRHWDTKSVLPHGLSGVVRHGTVIVG